MHGRRTGRSLAAAAVTFLFLFAACAGEEAVEVTVASVSVEPGSLELIRLQRDRITATVLDSKGRRMDAPLRWRSLDPDVATVDAGGWVSAISKGAATVVAEAGGKTAKVEVAVREAELRSLAIEPENLGLVEGKEAKLASILLDEVGRQYPGLPIVWTSSDPTVVEVEADGTVRGLLRDKSVMITASHGAFVASSTVTVLAPVIFVDVFPINKSILKGDKLQLSAVSKDILFREQEGRAQRWESSDPSIATVSESGLVTGSRPGEVVITCVVEDVEGWATVRILPRAETVDLGLPTNDIRVGGRLETKVMALDDGGAPVGGLRFLWSSTNPAVADVVEGVITGMGEGVATLIARNEEHRAEGRVTVKVRPAAQVVLTGADVEVLEAGATYQLGLSFREQDGTLVPAKEPRFSSYDPSVATVDSQGRVEIVGVGRATVMVQAEGFSASLDELAVVRFVDMALGDYTTCGLTRNGSVWCWGIRVIQSYLGGVISRTIIPEKAAEGLVAIRSGRYVCEKLPTLKKEDQPFCDLTIGWTHDGKVLAFVLGLPPIFLDLPPVVDLDAYMGVCGVEEGGRTFCGGTTLELDGPARRIFQGQGGHCALSDTGEAACFGVGVFAADLSGFAFETLALPTRDPTTLPLPHSWKHGCGLTTSGEAVCWGENEKGQIMDPPDETNPWTPPTIVSAGVRHVAVDHQVTFIVSSEGRLSVRGGMVLRLVPGQEEALDTEVESFARDLSVSSVHVGPGHHRCLLVGNGKPYCWGKNYRGEVGKVPGSNPDSQWIKRPIAIFPEFQ